MPLNYLFIRIYSTTAKVPVFSKELLSSNFNYILQRIHEKKKLTDEDKPIFNSYCHNISTSFRHSKTILQKIEPQDFKEFIQENKESSTIRQFYRSEVLINKENISLMQSFSQELNDPLGFCIKDSISTGDTTIAADLFLLYYHLYPNESLRIELTSQIISSLAFENPKRDELHLIKFLKLIKLFKKKKKKINLTTWQGMSISKKALSLNGAPVLRKHVLRQVMNSSVISNMTSRDEKIIAAYNLIENDHKSRNAAGIFYTWKQISRHYKHLTDHDPKILHIVLKTGINNKVYRALAKEIISRLPPKYYTNNSLILPTVIHYIVKTGNLKNAQKLMHDINDNILPGNITTVLEGRRCLTSLLRMHLKFNDSHGVDNLLKKIHDLYTEPSEEDYQAIIDQILKRRTLENLSKAIDYVSRIPQKKALLAYVKIINTIVDWQIASSGSFDKNSMHIIKNLLEKADQMDPHHKSSLWSIMASLYIKKLVHYKKFGNTHDSSKDTINLDLAKLIILKSCSNTKEHFTINPFIHSSPQNIILKITNNNKIVILRNIALASIKGCRKDIFLWCCSELYHKGVPIKELVLDWRLIYNYKFRSIKTLHDAKLKNKLCITGLPFIGKSLD